MPNSRNGSVAMDTVRAECTDAIAALERREEKVSELGPMKKCPDPDFPLTIIEGNRANRHALKVLLRKSVAEIDYAKAQEALQRLRDIEREEKDAKLKTSTKRWTMIICTIAGIVYALVDKIFGIF